jgi:RES domain-containing protein
LIETPIGGRWLRVLTPRWAHLPLSGEGASITGGRFNRIGARALYLSRTIETAWAEYQQMGALPRPGLVAGYDVQADAVVDLTDPDIVATLEVEQADLSGDWRYLWRIQHYEPPTWALVDRLKADGAQGLMYRSVLHPGGVNLVLWLDAPSPASIKVHDPADDLPRNPSSWT